MVHPTHSLSKSDLKRGPLSLSTSTLQAHHDAFSLLLVGLPLSVREKGSRSTPGMPIEVAVVLHEQVERWLVLFDFGESSDPVVEAIIDLVFSYQGDLSH